MCLEVQTSIFAFKFGCNSYLAELWMTRTIEAVSLTEIEKIQQRASYVLERTQKRLCLDYASQPLRSSVLLVQYSGVLGTDTAEDEVERMP